MERRHNLTAGRVSQQLPRDPGPHQKCRRAGSAVSQVLLNPLMQLSSRSTPLRQRGLESRVTVIQLQSPRQCKTWQCGRAHHMVGVILPFHMLHQHRRTIEAGRWNRACSCRGRCVKTCSCYGSCDSTREPAVSHRSGSTEELLDQENTDLHGCC